MEFSPEESFLPLLLHRATLHPSLPNAGFVGHYRGPYWGIIEAQARWCAGLFSGRLPWPSQPEMRKGIEFEGEMRERRPRMQWPRGDYVNFGQDLAKSINLSLYSEKNSDDNVATDIFGPHLFGLSQSDLYNSLCETLSQSRMSALFVAFTVFRELHGPWKVQRTYVSRRPEYPSGPSIGDATFTARKSSNNSYSIEYLYSEKTELTTSTGLTLSGTQQYIYTYHESTDQIDVYFTKRDEQFSLDYLFHELKFQGRTPDERNQKSPWKVNAIHPCGQDLYNVFYTFNFRGSTLRHFSISYEVFGPKKITQCTPPTQDHNSILYLCTMTKIRTNNAREFP
jgi:hypothetical protein